LARHIPRNLQKIGWTFRTRILDLKWSTDFLNALDALKRKNKFGFQKMVLMSFRLIVLSEDFVTDSGVRKAKFFDAGI